VTESTIPKAMLAKKTLPKTIIIDGRETNLPNNPANPNKSTAK
jgi:hypothetical protein